LILGEIWNWEIWNREIWNPDFNRVKNLLIPSQKTNRAKKKEGKWKIHSSNNQMLSSRLTKLGLPHINKTGKKVTTKKLI
jgi:hypothetical protein